MLQDYWKSNNFNLQCLAENMSKDRFPLIMRCLHFPQNPGDGQGSSDCLYKITPLIEFSIRRWRKNYFEQIDDAVA